MARRRHTPEQIIRKLREADRMLGEGKDLAEVARRLEVTEATYHRWRNQFGGMKADDAKRLKRIVADKELEIDALRWGCSPPSSSLGSGGSIKLSSHSGWTIDGVGHVRRADTS